MRSGFPSAKMRFHENSLGELAKFSDTSSCSFVVNSPVTPWPDIGTPFFFFFFFFWGGGGGGGGGGGVEGGGVVFVVCGSNVLGISVAASDVVWVRDLRVLFPHWARNISPHIIVLYVFSREKLPNWNKKVDLQRQGVAHIKHMCWS